MSGKPAGIYSPTTMELATTLLEKIEAALEPLDGFTTGEEIYKLADIHLNEARAHLQAAKQDIEEWIARAKASVPENGRTCPKCSSTKTRQVCMSARPVPGRFQCHSDECRGGHWFEIEGKEVTMEKWQDSRA